MAPEVTCVVQLAPSLMRVRNMLKDPGIVRFAAPALTGKSVDVVLPVTRIEPPGPRAMSRISSEPDPPR